MQSGEVRRYHGDDWSFSFTWQTSGPDPRAIPFDGLTFGARLIIGDGAPIPLTGASGGVEIEDRLTGKFAATVDRSVTEKIKRPVGNAPPPRVRVQVFVEDEAGDRKTIGVLPVRVVFL